MKKTALSFHYSTFRVFCQYFLCFSLLLSLLFLPISPVHAENDKPEAPTLSDDQKGAISMGCGSIKTSLTNLQKSDSAVRVHLGTTYQSILSNYLTPLNLRLVKNNQLSDSLNSIFNDFSRLRSDFNQQFVAYSRELESLSKINCKENPTDFYSALVKTREERAKTATLALKIRTLLDQHLEAVKELKNGF